MTTHTYIHKNQQNNLEGFSQHFVIFCCFTKLLFFCFFFGHLTLRKKHSDKFVLLYMKILTVHGIQQCASSFVVSAWR